MKTNFILAAINTSDNTLFRLSSENVRLPVAEPKDRLAKTLFKSKPTVKNDL